MITQERVLELYARANPVRNVDELVTDLEAASYLAHLHDRSSEVTQLDTRKTEQARESRRTVLVVAAAAVLILGTAVVLMTRDSEEVATSTTIMTSTTTPEATEEQTVRQLFSTRDYSVLEALVTEDWLSADVEASPYSNRRELMEAAWTNQEIIGVDQTLVTCEPVGVGAFNCTMSYTDDIMKAFDEPPMVDTTTFTFVDGKVNTGTFHGEDPRSGFSRYASASGIQQDFLDACNSSDTICLQFIMDNLEGWVAWEETGQTSQRIVIPTAPGAEGPSFFRPSFVAQIPDEWVHASTFSRAFLAPADVEGSNAELAVAISFVLPVTQTVSGTVEHLMSQGSLDASEARSILVGTAAGQTFHATGLSDEQLIELWAYEVSEPSGGDAGADLIVAVSDRMGRSTAGHQYDFYAVDVDGVTVLITVEYSSVDQYASHLPVVQEVIGSINWNCDTCQLTPP